MCSCYFCAALCAKINLCKLRKFDVYSVYSVYARDKELVIAHWVVFAMARSCSFSAVTGGACGSSRGFTDCVALNSCDDDISSHLQKHHLSRENVCEKDLHCNPGKSRSSRAYRRTVEKYDGLSSSSFHPWKVLAST